MRVAEKLYTSGFISYPRTETNKFPPDLDLNELVRNQTVSPQWGGGCRQSAHSGEVGVDSLPTVGGGCRQSGHDGDLDVDRQLTVGRWM